jgi:hypothetical protein
MEQDSVKAEKRERRMELETLLALQDLQPFARNHESDSTTSTATTYTGAQQIVGPSVGRDS